MADADLVLEHLRAIRNDLASFRSRMESDMTDIKARLNHLERIILTDKRDISLVFEDHARQQVSIDQLQERIQRIERRLEIGES